MGKIFYIDSENTGITFSYARYYINKFTTAFLPRLSKLERYYQNKNDAIMNRQFQDSSKPNNKIAHSFANYITTTLAAMFLGSPISYNSEDKLEDYGALLDMADEQDVNINIAANCSKFGYAIQLLYLDSEGDIKFAVLDNKQAVLVFSDAIAAELLYCIRFWSSESIDNISHEYIEIYSQKTITRYKDGILQGETEHLFSGIPIVVYKNNNDLTGDYEHILYLIDAYDLIESDSLNENEYFNNAYLYLNNSNIDTDDLVAMKENRVIYGENLNPAFILKGSQNADNDIEKNRIVSDIHKLSFTPDMSDNNFANNVSGVAMKYKLLGTLNIISNKQRKFKKGITERNKLLFDIMAVKSLEIPSFVDIIFTTALPENILETAQMINQLRMLVSDETLISQLPFVQDAAWEVEQVQASKDSDNPYSLEEAALEEAPLV